MTHVSKKAKLTDSQLVILSAAARRDDGALLPLPSSLNLNKGAAAMVLESLIRKEFAAESIASLDDEIWRQDDNGDPLTLIITDQGLAALGINGTDTIEDRFTPPPCDEIGNDNASTHTADVARICSPADDPVTGKSAPVFHSPDTAASLEKADHHLVRSSKSSSGVKPGSKQALVVKMIGQEDGATIDDLMTATGWLPHTVRAALSSLRKRGIAVTSDRTGVITRYRTAAK